MNLMLRKNNYSAYKRSITTKSIDLVSMLFSLVGLLIRSSHLLLQVCWSAYPPKPGQACLHKVWRDIFALSEYPASPHRPCVDAFLFITISFYIFTTPNTPNIELIRMTMMLKGATRRIIMPKRRRDLNFELISTSFDIARGVIT